MNPKVRPSATSLTKNSSLAAMPSHTLIGPQRNPDEPAARRVSPRGLPQAQPLLECAEAAQDPQPNTPEAHLPILYARVDGIVRLIMS